MSWKMVTRNGKNVTIKEAVEEIEAQKREIEEDRMLVSEFEAEHSYEIDRIFELIEHLYMEDTRAGFPEIYEFGPERLGIHLESILVFEGHSSDWQINRGYNRLHYFKQIIEAYEGRDKDADKLDISVFYQLTGRLPDEGLGYDGYYEKLLIHLYNTFCNESIK